MDQTQLKEIKERLAKATSWPWVCSINGFAEITGVMVDRDVIHDRQICHGPLFEDMRFIAHAPDDISTLITEIERLNGLNVCIECGGRIDGLCCNMCEKCYVKQTEF